MKKSITVLTATLFFLASTSLAFAGGYGHYRGHHHSHHHYRSHVYYSGDLFWFGLGMGVLTGIVAGSTYYAPSPPQPSVVYRGSTTVVIPPVASETGPSGFGQALSAEYGMVTVNAAELNLRSGPGLDHSVTGAVHKGEVLAVIESVPDWSYIRTPDGIYGWVMDKYTTPSRPVG